MAACGGGAGAGGSLEEPPAAPVLDPVVVPESSRLSSLPSCQRADGRLAVGEAARLEAGEYRLILVRGDAAGRPAWVEGRLELSPRVGPRSKDGWAIPMQGTTDVEIERVGAWGSGSLDSTDPSAPGVLVLRSDDPPTLLLRLGSAVNRMDGTAFDEAFTALTVQAVDEAGFAGAWRSGLFGDEVRGYFCAVAVSG